MVTDAFLPYLLTQHNKKRQNGTLESSCGPGESLGVLAMGAINELMSKNCVPHDFEDFLLQMFRNTFQLLQRLVRDEPNTTSRLQLLEPRLDFYCISVLLKCLLLYVDI